MLTPRQSRLFNAIPIALIKEYAYCPRYAYYLTFTRGVNYVTESMEAASSVIDEDRVRELCRGSLSILREYPVSSRSLGIYGIADYICVHQDYAVLIEVKALSKISKRSLLGRHRHYLVQAVAYAIAIEEALKKPVPYIIVVSSEGYVKVNLSPGLKQSVVRLINEVRLMVANEAEPRRINNPLKCSYCAFKRLCRP